MHIMAFLSHFQVIKTYRVLVTQICRLVTGIMAKDIMDEQVLVTQICRLVTGDMPCFFQNMQVLVTQICRLGQAYHII